MKKKMIDYYMKVAEDTAALSYGKRLKVGSIIVNNNRIISIGYNGSISGESNILEYEVFCTPENYEKLSTEERLRYSYNPIKNNYIGLQTKPDVIHAEKNAILKLTKSTESSEGSTLFVTTAPCLECSTLILLSGIKDVFYKELYRNSNGVDFLQKHNVQVQQI